MAEKKDPQLTSSHKLTQITTICRTTVREPLTETAYQGSVLPGSIITACLRWLTTGGPHPIRSAVLLVLLLKTNPENSGGAKRREKMPVPNMGQPPRNPHPRIHLGWRMHAPPGSTLSQTRCVHQQDDWPETTQRANPTTLKPETGSRGRAVLPGSLTLLLSTLVPLPVKPFALSTDAIHFRVLDKSPLLGPGRCPPSGNTTIDEKDWNLPGKIFYD